MSGPYVDTVSGNQLSIAPTRHRRARCTRAKECCEPSEPLRALKCGALSAKVAGDASAAAAPGRVLIWVVEGVAALSAPTTRRVSHKGEPPLLCKRQQPFRRKQNRVPALRTRDAQRQK